jgi:hypothetical protein
MNNKCIIALILFATIAALFACSDNSSDDIIKSLRIDAENAFRRGDYKGAYEICSKMVAEDSTISFGYHGMAKAKLGERGINIADILGYVDIGENETGGTNYKFAFLDSTVKFQNNILQAMKNVSAALAPLDRRDSLTYLYEFHQRSINDKNFDTTFIITVKDTLDDGEVKETTKPVTLTERLGDFRKIFCNATGTCQGFPLSDREIKGSYFRNFLLMSQMIRTPLEFSDSNKDGCIAKRGITGTDHPDKREEWKNWGCSSADYAYDFSGSVRMENGKLILDMSDITEDEAEDLNNQIDSFSGDMDEVISIMDALGMNSGSGDLKGDIEKYKANAVFYKVGTGIDEDGDGCIEEDILDGQDNDGDGLSNSNARAVDSDPINNSMSEDPSDNDTISFPAPVYISNRKGETCSIENHNPSSCTALWGDTITKMATVIKFTQKPDYWTTNNTALKLLIAQDTICPPTHDLKYRQEHVGGCWPNYDENKFIKYWLKRELARNNNKSRVHPTCKTCEGIEECLKKP